MLVFVYLYVIISEFLYVSTLLGFYEFVCLYTFLYYSINVFCLVPNYLLFIHYTYYLGVQSNLNIFFKSIKMNGTEQLI